ncbi:uncharacterized protein KY384_002336 [Bacidia gigantensis]|uniref:uncharacterized protein n=1 Tax=Bacidia gigantensis TaxID=2732470 RepID=UPI001D051AFF|nr:uncharacterized protein KY384_002336 [Bacidia gigantensis]KAG8532459.1 hypothetical protein KY384_002336 [Bacidia gigantensis]
MATAPQSPEDTRLLSASELPVDSVLHQRRADSPDRDIRRMVSFRSSIGSLELKTPTDPPNQYMPHPTPEKHGYDMPFDKGPIHHSQPYSFRLKLDQSIYRWWLAELLCYLGSLISLIIIIVILRRYDGRPQPNWPHNITLNSVISWFTTLFKANLLVPITACLSQASWIHFRSKSHALTDMVVYDAASRGPLGSLLLLWSFRAQYVASIGALITVLALGIDPIIQQTISIKTREVNVTTPAHIGRAQSFLSYDDSPSKVFDPYNGAEVMTLPLSDMLGAMFAGMFAVGPDTNGSFFQVDAACSTGNCTYPAFQTLAVCSSCDDITSQLSHNCSLTRPKDPTDDDSQDNGGTGEGEEDDSDPNNRKQKRERNGDGSMSVPEAYCSHGLPNGFKLNKTSNDSELGEVASSCARKPVGNVNLGHTILNFTRIWSGGPSNGQSLVDNVTATQCFLHWCVNTIEASVRNGQLLEIQRDTWHDNTTQWWNGTAGGLQNDLGDAFYDFQNQSTARTDLRPPAMEPNTSASSFPVAWFAHRGVSDWLSQKMTLSTSLAVYNGGFNLDASIPRDTPNREMIRLLRDANMTLTFANIAKSMTRNIRSASSDLQRSGMNASIWAVPDISPAGGTATSADVYVAVRWGWLSFPIVLLLLTIIFFTLTVLGTIRNKLAVWKSSPLPLMFNRLQEPVTNEAEPLMTNKVREMEKVASQMDVRLQESDAGLRLARWE